MVKYTILQIVDPEITGCKYAFINYNYAKSHGFDLANHYAATYSGEVGYATVETIPYMILENLFVKFNQRRPDDFFGHSLSVSDVVILDYDEHPSRFFYCDSLGWREITTEAASFNLI